MAAGSQRELALVTRRLCRLPTPPAPGPGAHRSATGKSGVGLGEAGQGFCQTLCAAECADSTSLPRSPTSITAITEKSDQRTTPITVPIKIAFLFLLVDRLLHEPLWRSWLNEARSIVLFHATKPQEIASDWIRARMVPWSIPSLHGEIGMVKAQLGLLREALKTESVQRFVFVSPSCCPIKRFDRAYALLRDDRRSWVKPVLQDFSDQYLPHCDRTVISPEHFWKSESWITLNREHAEIVASDDITAAFGAVFAPNEHYVTTRLSMAGIQSAAHFTGQDSTDCDWERGRPYLYHALTREDILRLRNSPCILARKFAEDSNIQERFGEIVH